MSAHTGLAPGRVAALLEAAGRRVARVLGFMDSPLRILADAVSAEDFAGLLRVAPGIELEVAPKFIGDAAGWREDFFLVAMLAKHGSLLDAARLRASAAGSADLATLIGRALAGMYWDNHRRPLRTYRRSVVRDFSVEGEVAADEVVLPDGDGFEQEVLGYSRSNPFNAVVREAALALGPGVGETDLRASLARMAHVLAPQQRMARPRQQRVPSRARAWQPTYDLAVDVLEGLGLSYLPGPALAPGYVVHTWRVWEELVTLGLRAGLNGAPVLAQRTLDLGLRKGPGGASARLLVRPDLLIGSDPAAADLVADAKYKGRVGRAQRITEADVYEALAFARAAGCDRVGLFHPWVPHQGASGAEAGQTHIFEEVVIGAVTIVGIATGVRGISKVKGLRAFCGGVGVAARELMGRP